MESTSPNITDEEIALIKSAKAGNKSAFSRMFYKYKDFVESILLSYIKDKDEARDIANIVFVNIYDKLSKFVEYKTFKGWLRTVTKNTAIDYLRTVKDKQVYVESNDYRLQRRESYSKNEDDIASQMTFDNITSQIPNLTPIKRKVLAMFYIDNYTIADISKCLGIPVNTIKSILFRFRKQVFNKFKLK